MSKIITFRQQIQRTECWKNNTKPQPGISLHLDDIKGDNLHVAS